MTPSDAAGIEDLSDAFSAEWVTTHALVLGPSWSALSATDQETYFTAAAARLNAVPSRTYTSSFSGVRRRLLNLYVVQGERGLRLATLVLVRHYVERGIQPIDPQSAFADPSQRLAVAGAASGRTLNPHRQLLLDLPLQCQEILLSSGVMPGTRAAGVHPVALTGQPPALVTQVVDEVVPLVVPTPANLGLLTNDVGVVYPIPVDLDHPTALALTDELAVAATDATLLTIALIASASPTAFTSRTQTSLSAGGYIYVVRVGAGSIGFTEAYFTTHGTTPEGQAPVVALQLTASHYLPAAGQMSFRPYYSALGDIQDSPIHLFNIAFAISAVSVSS